MDWISRDNNFQSWSMTEIGLGRLGVIKSTMTNSTPGGSKSKFPTLKLSSRSIPVFSGFVDNLIKGWEYIIAKLNFSDGSMPRDSNSNSKPRDSLFREWRIKNSLDPILFNQSTRAPEYTSKLHVFTEYFRTKSYGILRWISLETYIDGRVYGCEQIHVISLQSPWNVTGECVLVTL